ncbi:MAG: SusC/RagA family TonB-linked outer membrane protein [Prevotella sp.]|nr:SusC/RagA family TonB-linked outer membrane protein [Prevotella sp.]
MKHNKYIILSALLALSAIPATAQIDAPDSAEVNVAFRKVAKEDIMGGVSSLNYRELMEKNYNTYSLDNMQGYVAGYNGAGMWGYTDQLVLIDGVPREANNVLPSEIEEVTFLKGAQAVVLYGSRAAKGAILITTKRGRVSDGLSINVRANTGWNVRKSLPEYLNSADYMTLYNEARQNDGLAPQYTPEEIADYASGANPYRYPNVDFYSSDYIKKSYNRSDVTAEIEGGNNRTRFYANVSYYREGSYLNFGEAKDNYTDRFNVRGNVDMQLNDFLSAYVNANATYYNARSARSTQSGDYWQVAATWRPNRIAPLIPISMIDPTATDALNALTSSRHIIDGQYFFGAKNPDLTNIFADYYAAGKSTWTSRQFQFDAGVNLDLNGILKGLTFHTMIAIDYATTYSTSYENQYATFEPTWDDETGLITALDNHESVDQSDGNQRFGSQTDNQTIAFNAHFDYNRTFADVHHVSAMLVANGYQQSKSGQYHRTNNVNLGLNLSYNYDKKYYAEFSLATPWTTKLAEGKRAGFSPSGTIGWNIAREKFMEGSIFDNLTVSVSASNLKTDMDIENYYMYLGTYQSGGWFDWNGLTGFSLYQSKRGGNNDLAYLKRKEFSASIHAELLKRSLSFDASFFTSQMDGGIILATNQVPSYFRVGYPESSFISYMNYNKDNRTGFDVAVKYKKQLGEFGIEAGANLTYYKTKAAQRDDKNYADEYQYREGQPLDAIWGYQCAGFFDKGDFDENGNVIGGPNGTMSYQLGGTPKMGDLKYVDQNNDGIIDTKDQVNLATGGWYGAPTTLGINLTLKYKNFTLFMLGVGGFGGHGVKGQKSDGSREPYWWVQGTDKYSAVVLDRVQYTFDEEGNATGLANAATASYPRLTTTNGANNYQVSDFWVYSTSRFDLAKVQLTYDFPKSVFNKVNFIKGVSVYVSGNSLLTFAKEKKLLEMNLASAPQSRFYNLGFKVLF